MGVQLHGGHPVLELLVPLGHGGQLGHLGLEPLQLRPGHPQLGLRLGQLPPELGQRPGGLLQAGAHPGLLGGQVSPLTAQAIQLPQGVVPLPLGLVQPLLQAGHLTAVGGGGLLDIPGHVPAVKARQGAPESLGHRFHPVLPLFLLWGIFYHTFRRETIPF